MKLKISCDWCGKEFVRDSASLKGKKHHFCCRRCLADFSSKSKNPEGYVGLKDYTGMKLHMAEHARFHKELDEVLYLLGMGGDAK